MFNFERKSSLNSITETNLNPIKDSKPQRLKFYSHYNPEKQPHSRLLLLPSKLEINKT